MTKEDIHKMLILSETIRGEINRICVTTDLSEFNFMYEHVKINLDSLHKLVFNSRFNVESEVAL